MPEIVTQTELLETTVRLVKRTASKRPRIGAPRGLADWAICVAMAGYTVLVLAAIHHHEPWADEAQAWLLARDASLWQLWTKLLHYEGSPGLWHTLLHIAIRLGLPYAAFGYVPAIFACAAAWLVLKHSPFPLPLRLLLPFSFFLGYQYVVVARSYDLLPAMLFGVAILYRRPESYTWLIVALLCSMSALSAHAMILSGCIAVSFGVFQWPGLSGAARRRFAWGGLVFLSTAGLCALAAFPARDVAFVTEMKFSMANLWEFSSYTLREAFTGEPISTCAALVISLPFLWRGRGLLFFALSTLLTCLFGAVVYAAVWHQGILLLVWVFALWISAGHRRVAASGKWDNAFAAMAMLGLAAVIAVQCYWTVKSVEYDWKSPYSAGRDAAHFLMNSRIGSRDLCAVGYATTAIQPYFSASPFRRGTTYWDWSKWNQANDPGRILAAGCPHLLVGYKTGSKRDDWTTLTRLIGYRPVKHFEGNLFWHTKTWEAESFDLYVRHSADSQAPAVSSTIRMNDPSSAAQLISGFYPLEGNAWRWTARNFSFLLGNPDGKASNGSTVTMTLYLSEDQIKRLGTITLRANAGGQALPPRTFTRPGVFEYSVRIPGAEASEPLIWVQCQLDKAAEPSRVDSRELGVVVTSIKVESGGPPVVSHR
jgi:hypothetical protein